jgi:hypothetical protein
MVLIIIYKLYYKVGTVFVKNKYPLLSIINNPRACFSSRTSVLFKVL